MQLRITNLTYNYGTRKAGYDKNLVFKNISYVFPKTGFVSITGKSGQGKTTLLYLLSGILKPISGQIEFVDIPGPISGLNKLASLKSNLPAVMPSLNQKIKDKKNSRPISKSDIGFVFQSHYLIDYLSNLENIRIGNPGLAKDSFDREVDNLFKMCGVDGLQGKLPSEVSGGQKQRVSLIRAISGDKKVIFADEPTSALDDENTEIIYKLLKEISKTKLVIVITHDLSVLDIADVNLKIDKGSLINLPK
jgi:lipoprotein-releasing system ATP-binding protein